MPEETRHVLLKTAILSPSAYNIQNWRIVDVRDSAQRAAIPMNSNVKKH
ncbi:nitroreductase family protein [Acidithiobacillus ferrooxidans]|nr:nitroreductase family protein [Acidithiobacillus ferrooxidans]MCR2831875.1 nitroreductase family protein [Acidithiobacillus ferrooxidans]